MLHLITLQSVDVALDTMTQTKLQRFCLFLFHIMFKFGLITVISSVVVGLDDRKQPKLLKAAIPGKAFLSGKQIISTNEARVAANKTLSLTSSRADCSAGTEPDGDACVSCESGTYSESGLSCSKCPAGTYSSTSATSCTTCVDESSSKEGSSECTCSSSHYLWDSTENFCNPICPSGSFDGGEGDCVCDDTLQTFSTNKWKCLGVTYASSASGSLTWPALVLVFMLALLA